MAGAGGVAAFVVAELVAAAEFSPVGFTAQREILYEAPAVRPVNVCEVAEDPEIAVPLAQEGLVDPAWIAALNPLVVPPAEAKLMLTEVCVVPVTVRPVGVGGAAI